MLEKSGNFAHASGNLRLIWVSEVGVAKWLDSATYKYSAECASSYVSRTCVTDVAMPVRAVCKPHSPDLKKRRSSD